MVKGNSLHLFNSNGRAVRTYKDGALLLRRRYNSSYNRSRFLAKYQSTRLSEEMAKTPKRSQMEVFIDFIAELSTLQKQLDTIYQGDQMIPDQLLDAVDLPSIPKTLRDRTPGTSDKAINRIANGFSYNRRTAGSTVVHWENA